MLVGGGNRMRQTSRVLVTMLGDYLPQWIFYHGVYTGLFYPFYPRVKACFNCRMVGHQTGVCLHPKRNRCAHCGQGYPPFSQGTQPTCHARCIVCKGSHATNSSNYKYHLVKKPIPSGYAPAQAPDEEPQPQQPSILRTNHSTSQEQSYPPLGQPQQRQQTGHSGPHNRGRSRFKSRIKSRSKSLSRSRSASYPISPSSPLPSSPGSSKGLSQQSSVRGPRKLAWAQGPPASLKESPTS
ncbi:hypothetical protein HPB51_015406 [Rhipicephalus microplus]|uniref:Uncharacterized protein n=1 Tax=Rhipicephalus microplus TaxID=6941 RepID=A0A9J6DVW5_RHIMP|nr:hypothetical protein HPB51_015406 [Rhipicephalus microplus]